MLEWKLIEEFPNYEVSEAGDVRRLDTGLILKPVSDRGYQLYRLYRDGERPAIRGHILVLKAFVGPKPFEDAEGCHDDGNRGNNRYTNLRWDTRTANMGDRVRHGTAKTYPRAMARRTPEVDAEIKRLRRVGLSLREVSKIVNVSMSAVSRVSRRITISA